MGVLTNLSLGHGPLPWLPGSKDRQYLLRLLEWEAVLYADSCPNFSHPRVDDDDDDDGFVTLTTDQLGL